MATIYLRLSKRVHGGDNLHEVLLRVRNGKDYDLNAKSGIYVTEDNFRNGEIVVNRRKVGNDVKYHEVQYDRMSKLCNELLNRLSDTPKNAITTQWLKEQINDIHNPSNSQDNNEDIEQKKTIFDWFNIYLNEKQFSDGRTRAIKVVARAVARYERFICMSDKKRRDFVFDVDSVNKEDIDEFRNFLKNEKSLSEKHPRMYKKILAEFPASLGKGHQQIEIRGDNTVKGMLKTFKTFWNWLTDEAGATNNRPFTGIRIGMQQYGTPYYITISERNKIADMDLSAYKVLAIQRDIFTFQCLIGCRVGDLYKLTKKNIMEGKDRNGNTFKILEYVPHKTKDEGQQPVVARVPLIPRAVALIEKYDGRSKDGKLFPFIAENKYNKAIKKIFTLADITRNVIVRDSITGENTIHPLNEIASTHLARRTFIGNAYFNTPDPNIIGKMSGHVEGSKSFSRYRKIEDSTLIDVVKGLE